MTFDRPLRFEIAYQNAITKLLQKFFKIPKFQTWNEVQQILQEYNSASQFLSGFAKQLATNMITHIAAQNANSWREAARVGGRGSIIYNLLRRELYEPKMRNRLYFLIQSNAQFISTVPQRIAERTTHHVQQQFMQGRRSEYIMRDLTPYMQSLRKYEVQRIARTEVAKADTAITRTRAESIGLEWYRWVTAHDARVRTSHNHMNDVLINWNDPPSPEALVHEKNVGNYHAGNIYNCRCVALPLVELTDVRWPTKVYNSGRITQMSRLQFERISGNTIAA
jgi:SPP1 gp7 family putative phage head morphogenesis protein